MYKLHSSGKNFKIKNNMSNNLQKILNKNKTTQATLAKYLKLESSMVSRYCTGAAKMSEDTICKIADYFHVSTDELLGRETNNINLSSLDDKTRDLVKKILVLNNAQVEQVSAMMEIMKL